MKPQTISMFLLITAALLGCELRFGEDVELSGSDFDATKISEVSALTGIAFPDGTTGIEYLYFRSGIDDSLAAKLQIPNEKIELFRVNSIFVEGEETEAISQIGSGQSWWRVEELTDRSDRYLALPDGKCLEIIFGKERDAFVVYVSWFAT